MPDYVRDDEDERRRRRSRQPTRSRASTRATARRPTLARAPRVEVRPASERRLSEGSKKRSRGLFEQIGDAITAIPSGVVHLADTAGRSILGTARLAGEELIERPLGELGIGDGAETEGRGFMELAREYNPLLAELVESVGQTAHRVTNPSEYGRAVREGRIVDALLEDVSNLSLAGAAAGRALGAGARAAGAPRLARVAEVVEDVARLGDRAGAAPAAVFTVGPRLVARAAERAGHPIGPALARAGERFVDSSVGSRIVERFPRLTPEGREMHRILTEGRSQIAEGQGEVVRRAQLAERALRDEDAQVAASLVAEGTARALAPLAGQLSPPDFARLATEIFPEERAEYAVTPQALRLALDYETGRLDPALRKGIDDTIAALGPVRTARQRRLLDTGELHPEQLGDAPLSNALMERLERPAAEVERQYRAVDAARERAERLRSIADARLAATRPLREPEAAGRVFERGRQLGHMDVESRQARAEARARQRELQQAIDAVEAADAAGDTNLAALVAEVDARRRVFEEAEARLASASRQADATSAFLRLEPEMTFEEGGADLGMPAVAEPGARQQLGPAELEQTASARAERRQAQREVSLARRDLEAAQRNMERAAGRLGRTPGTLAQAVDRAAQRLADAEDRAARLTARTDLVDRPERLPSLRGTHTRGMWAGQAEQRARNAERALRVEERRLGRRIQQFQRVVDELDSMAEVAPARFRPAMRAAQRGVEELSRWADELDADAPGAGDVLRQLAEETPTTLSDMVAEGIDPTHLVGGRLPSQVNQGRGRLGLPRDRRRLRSQRERRTDVAPRTTRGQAQIEAQRVDEFVQRRTAEQVVARFGVKAADLGLDETLTGSALRAEMEAQGFTPWNPHSILERAPDREVTPDTTFIPTPLWEAYRNEYMHRPGLTLQGLSWVNRKWKNLTLPISVRWHAGNIVGNYLMATVGAGIDPVTLARHMGEARAILKQGDPGQVLPRRLFSSGLTHGELAYLRDPLDRRQGRLGRAIDKSYAFNEGIDNLYRAAVYLAKKAEGKSPEQALKLALRAMGDFTRMTPFERRVVREIIPFYAWARHITQLSLRLPIEHPARVAWTLHLAEMFGDEQEGLPPFLKGSVLWGDEGDEFLPVGSFNPFGDVGGSPLLTPQGALRGMSPAIKLAAAAGLGLNLNRGGGMLTRPHGTEDTDWYGRVIPAPLLRPDRLGELANVALSQVGIARNIRDLIEGPKVRYDTGQVMDIDPGRGRFEVVLGLLGVPVPEEVDVERMRRVREQRLRRLRG